MKTSLICLLLLAAVACAAPQAGEVPGEKRAGMAEKTREKIAEKREKINEKMRERAKEKREEMAEKLWEKVAEKREEMAEEKQEESKKAVAVAKNDGEAESRNYFPCYGLCYGSYGEAGCYYNKCYHFLDFIFYDYSIGCECCRAFTVTQYCY